MLYLQSTKRLTSIHTTLTAPRLHTQNAFTQRMQTAPRTAFTGSVFNAFSISAGNVYQSSTCSLRTVSNAGSYSAVSSRKRNIRNLISLAMWKDATRGCSLHKSAHTILKMRCWNTEKKLGLHFQSLQRSSSLMRMRITHTMNALAGGKSRGQTGEHTGCQDWNFNSRSYGRTCSDTTCW